ncbi:hypothetical protein L3V82_05110 [Thiotrichales bacterium 19S3-7]|nr:hypothetical protein [Thiotrichales bacterium 19S3-7]MCF6801471.1 hypothetical protein [Thiotrichales bacterium 19S3-11]
MPEYKKVLCMDFDNTLFFRNPFSDNTTLSNGYISYSDHLKEVANILIKNEILLVSASQREIDETKRAEMYAVYDSYLGRDRSFLLRTHGSEIAYGMDSAPDATNQSKKAFINNVNRIYGCEGIELTDITLFDDNISYQEDLEPSHFVHVQRVTSYGSSEIVTSSNPEPLLEATALSDYDRSYLIRMLQVGLTNDQIKVALESITNPSLRDDLLRSFELQKLLQGSADSDYDLNNLLMTKEGARAIIQAIIESNKAVQLVIDKSIYSTFVKEQEALVNTIRRNVKDGHLRTETVSQTLDVLNKFVDAVNLHVFNEALFIQVQKRSFTEDIELQDKVSKVMGSLDSRTSPFDKLDFISAHYKGDDAILKGLLTTFKEKNNLTNNSSTMYFFDKFKNHLKHSSSTKSKQP